MDPALGLLVDATHAARGRSGRGGGPAIRRYTVRRRRRGDVGLAMSRISRTYPSVAFRRESESRPSKRPRNVRNLILGIRSGRQVFVRIVNVRRDR
jgi:hypothetical protein